MLAFFTDEENSLKLFNHLPEAMSLVGDKGSCEIQACSFIPQCSFHNVASTFIL
jgi:hypothetical protein